MGKEAHQRPAGVGEDGDGDRMGQGGDRPGAQELVARSPRDLVLDRIVREAARITKNAYKQIDIPLWDLLAIGELEK